MGFNFAEIIKNGRPFFAILKRNDFQGRICLSASFRFGLGGMVFLYVLTPLFSRLLAKIPPKGRQITAAAVVCLLAVDLILTLYLASVHGFNPTLAQPR